MVGTWTERLWTIRIPNAFGIRAPTVQLRHKIKLFLVGYSNDWSSVIGQMFGKNIWIPLGKVWFWVVTIRQNLVRFFSHGLNSKHSPIWHLPFKYRIPAVILLWTNMQTFFLTKISFHKKFPARKIYTDKKISCVLLSVHNLKSHDLTLVLLAENVNTLKSMAWNSNQNAIVLCISTSFRVLRAPESWWKQFFQPFWPFFLFILLKNQSKVYIILVIKLPE